MLKTSATMVPLHNEAYILIFETFFEQYATHDMSNMLNMYIRTFNHV